MSQLTEPSGPWAQSKTNVDVVLSLVDVRQECSCTYCISIFSWLRTGGLLDSQYVSGLCKAGVQIDERDVRQV